MDKCQKLFLCSFASFNEKINKNLEDKKKEIYDLFQKRLFGLNNN